MKPLEAYFELLATPATTSDTADAAVTRSAPHAPLRLWSVAAGLLAAQLASTLVLLGSWACIGNGALTGHFDTGWLAAWALALASLVPLESLTTWLKGVLIVGIGGVLKERLMAGALAIPAGEVRRRGSARLLSEVLESEGLDEHLAGGGVTTVLALMDLLVTAGLFLALGDLAQFGTLFAWIVMLTAVFARTLAVRLQWSRQRLVQTAHMTEHMIAHRTRVSQQSSTHWHDASDRLLARYVSTSRHLDRYSAAIQSALPRGYVVIAVLAMAPAFLAGHTSQGRLAAVLGAILFGANALQRSGNAFARSAAAHSAWLLIAPLFAAGARTADATRTADPSRAADPPRAATMSAPPGLQAGGVRYTPAGLRDPVLRDISFSIAPGERILLEGSSGSGKSTLAGILGGSIASQGGYVLAGGMDRQTLGPLQWPRKVALAPQYHENYLLSGTLIFNLLLGRPLPHTAADIEAAAALCAELGLGNLIERMPAGLHQIVGETGWRLSQGERSRIFLARALLQDAGVVVLDESLAALDPENLALCLACLMRRKFALILIAHP